MDENSPFEPSLKSLSLADDVNIELEKMGLSRVKAPESDGTGWRSYREKFQVLKVVDLLLRKIQIIDQEAARRTRSVIDPMKAKIKSNSMYVKTLEAQEKELDDEIAAAKVKLAECKRRKEMQKIEHAKEIDSLKQKLQ